MQFVRRPLKIALLCAVLACLSVGYAVAEGQRAVFVMTGCGFALFAGCLAASRLRGHAFIDETQLGGKALTLLIAAFALPLLFSAVVPQLMFWRTGSGNAVALAWFLFALVALNVSRRNSDSDDGSAMSWDIAFLMTWSSVLWMTIAWDVGGRTLYLESVASNASDALGAIFKSWDVQPVSKHFGIAVYGETAAYSGHSPGYLAAMYLLVKATSVVMSIDLSASARLNILFCCAMMGASVIAFFRISEAKFAIGRASTQMALVVGIGGLITIPDMWVSMLNYGTDNTYPLVAFVSLVLYAFVLKNKCSSRAFKGLLYFYCLTMPVFGAITLLTLAFFFFGKGFPSSALSREQRTDYTKTIGVGAVIITTAIFYPRVVAWALGYQNFANSLFFRSGLDGDMTYYSSVLQAVLDPVNVSPIRPWSAIVPVLALGAIAYSWSARRLDGPRREFALGLIFLLSPYLFSIVFTPQAVSIHPYYYDYLFLFPIAFASLRWFLDPVFHVKLTGPGNYGLFLLLSSFVLFNLTRIAQAARYL